MYIAGCKIDWKIGWANQASINLLLRDVPDPYKDIIHFPHRIGPTTVLWYGHSQGMASYFADNVLGPDTLESRRADGFGGRTFTIRTGRGTHDLKGPWSSRPAVMNEQHPVANSVPCMDVAYTSSDEVWERGYTFYAGAVTLPFLNQFLKKVWGIQVEPYRAGEYATWGLDRAKILGIPEEELTFMRKAGVKYEWVYSAELGAATVPSTPDQIREMFGEKPQKKAAKYE